MKRDPYKNKERWDTFKQNHFKNTPKGVRQEDWKLLIEFLKDMELGLNVSKEKKGKRTQGTLLNLSSHNKLFLENFKKPLTQLTKKDLHYLEKNIEEGKILRKDKKRFGAFGNYIKDFKVFWNWGLRTGKFKENIVLDITSKTNKPSWVYLSEEKIREFFNQLSLNYRTICFFLYDAGLRVTELNSLKIKDFSEDYSKVTISDEISKTFGRTINLKISTQLIKEYVKINTLESDDYFLIKKPFAINKYLRYHAIRLFGKENISHPKSRGKFGEFTMYDIRHNSACFWFNKYPTHKGLMYRFGWRKADKIEYYSEFLGVSDEITDIDMVLGEDKNKIIILQDQIKKSEEELKTQKQETKKLAQGLIDLANKVNSISKGIK